MNTNTVPAAAFYVLTMPGYLRLAGPDRFDFLQRQTTNDVRLTTPDHPVMTVLTTPTARILDVLTLIDEGDHLGILTLAGRGARTLRELRGKIFFMDKVTLTDASAAFAQILVDGASAAQVVAAASAAVADLRSIGHRGWAGAGYTLLAPVERLAEVAQALLAAGASALTAEAYDLLRVEAGLPGPLHELTEEYNPLEAGLTEMISEQKGCYTGQEIIARQVTYQKVTKQLIGLRLETSVASGSRVESEGKGMGEVTSCVLSPRFGPIALAYLKRPFELGDPVRVVAAEGAVSGSITALPFA